MEITNATTEAGGEPLEEDPTESVANPERPPEADSRAEQAESYQYDFAVDPDSDSTHAHVIGLVGEGRRVLELGPASGYMSAVLRNRGCTVVGVELDPEMAVQAARFCERVIVGDLDTLDLEAELGEDRFDVIVAADVLEHLRDPLATLRTLLHFLKPEGWFVVSLPNVAHASVRLALLEGRFQYQDLGLLDRTHLRFFTHESIAQLFDEAELAIVEMHRQEAPIDTTEIAVHTDAVPAEVIRELERDPDARTYQFVIKALPLAAPGMRELQGRLREQALATDAAAQKLGRVERELEPRIRELEQALADLAGREGQVRVALIEAHDQILRRDEQMDDLTGRLKRLQRDLKDAQEERACTQEQLAAHAGVVAARDEEIRRLRVRLERILNSPPARLYASIGRLPLLRSVVKRRTAGYEQAVQDARRTGE
ncbi:MAG: methyltransferase domain-containing protein [Solirubrobacterales bacterium]